MLFIFVGPSCSGKSSTADALRRKITVRTYAGNENEAWHVFENELRKAASAPIANSIVYVITEKNKLPGLQLIKGARFV
jgi:hypothetical protein